LKRVNAALQDRLAQRCVHVERRAPEPALQQGQILLRGLVAADQCLQCSQCRAPPRENQHAAGVAIEPVGKFEAVVGARRAHQLDRPETDAAAAVAGDPGGLVDHEEVAVFVDDRLRHAIGLRRRWGPCLLRFGNPHRRYTYLVAVGKKIVDPLPVLGLCYLHQAHPGT
jgi:hypothetical protein